MEVKNVLDLPNGVLMDIFEYLTYDEISKKRLVCRRIDEICQELLNRGFTKVMRQHGQCAKRIKSLLPRRESERRNHCLSRHADILTSIETRISMLSMTYTKYIDLNLCCFIPGKILDEIFSILRLIGKTNKQLRPHEVLQELRDISSMAIEHFDEKISNTLKKSIVGPVTKICSNSLDNNGRNATTTSGCTSSSSCIDFDIYNNRTNGLGNWNNITNRTMQNRCLEIMRQSVNNLLNFKPLEDNSKQEANLFDFSAIKNEQPTKHTTNCTEAQNAMFFVKNLQTEYKKGILKMHRMQQIQNHHARRLQLSLAAISHQNLQIIELKKRVEDLDAKNRELLANIKQMNGGGKATAAATGTAKSVIVAEGDDDNDNDNDNDVIDDAAVETTAKTQKLEPTNLLIMAEPLAIDMIAEPKSKTLPSVRKRLHEETMAVESAATTASNSSANDWPQANKKHKI